jgi:hypothetical protein
VFHLARGGYFKWAAADDICAATYLERCFAAIRKNPDAVLAYPRTTIINESGVPVRPYDDGLALTSSDPAVRFINYLDRVGECNAVFGVIRSDVLRRTALIGNYAGSDVVLLAELSLYGHFVEILERLFFRRDHPKASSSDKSDESQQEFFDPKTRGRPSLELWRHLGGYSAAIRRSPLSHYDKARTTGILLRRAIMNRHQLWQELRDAAKTLTSQGAAKLTRTAVRPHH